MRRRPALPALAALVLVIAQLAALAHHAETRHVTCAEHGEELEAAELAEQLHACDDDHLVAVDRDSDGDHEDCALARALHQSSTTPGMWLPVALLAHTGTAPTLFAVDTARVQTARYRLAPKTSPPSLV